jgi:hypothetical protein
MGRGRPKGSKNKSGVSNAVVSEWSHIYNEHGDTGKAIVLARVESLGLEQRVIVERMALAYSRMKMPELKGFVNKEVDLCLKTLQRKVRRSDNIKKLATLIPESNIVIDLSTLKLSKVRRVNRKK